MSLGIVLEGKVNHISETYFPIIEKIRRYGNSYPEYLTLKEIEMTRDSVPFFDEIARGEEKLK